MSELEHTVLVWLLFEQDDSVLVAKRKADTPPFAGQYQPRAGFFRPGMIKAGFSLFAGFLLPLFTIGFELFGGSPRLGHDAQGLGR